nr:hypothetical protein CTI12_AA250730 [Tanacetum cinerariifolium]
MPDMFLCPRRYVALSFQLWHASDVVRLVSVDGIWFERLLALILNGSCGSIPSGWDLNLKLYWKEFFMSLGGAYETSGINCFLRSKSLGRMTDPSVASDKVFGGKVVLFGGDFRKILPVITNGGRQDVVNATINSFYLWEKYTVLRLTVNMRLGSGSTESEKKKSKNLPIGY